MLKDTVREVETASVAGIVIRGRSSRQGIVGRIVVISIEELATNEEIIEMISGYASHAQYRLDQVIKPKNNEAQASFRGI